jgi:hypothetical protein
MYSQTKTGGQRLVNVRFDADTVAKVVLHWGSKILRALGAAFV